MKNIPKFLKDFAEQRVEKLVISAEGVGEQKEVLNKQLQEIEAAGRKMEELNASVPAQVDEALKTRAVRVDITRGRRTYDELKAEKDALSGASGAVGLSDGIVDSSSTDRAEGAVDRLTEDLALEWENAPYSKEEAEKLFAEEHLASLSMEEYVLLLRRFPSEMVAHVTRQGIRDHAESMWHTAGEGAYSDGFMKMAQDGRLRSPLGVKALQKEKKEVIKDMLGLDELEHRYQAVKKLKNMTGERNQGDQSSYGDRAAIHFATEEVADRSYGSETGNEIFIAYPSMHVASQYHFKGQLTNSGGGQWNDQWVWANEERGMDINAGLVFIPKEAKVDPRNGSRYELDKNNNPIVNEDFVGVYRAMTESPQFLEFAEQTIEVMGGREVNRKKIENMRAYLKDTFGISDSRLQDAVLNVRNLSNIRSAKKEEIRAKPDEQERLSALTNKIISQSLNRHGILYQEAKNTVSSEEFWEDYFLKNPKTRPSKTVYYGGNDPTAALQKWQEQHGLRKVSLVQDKEHMGFSERKISGEEASAVMGKGLSRFRSVAEEIIEEHYKDKVPPKIIRLPEGVDIINPDWIKWNEVHGVPDVEKKKGPPPLPAMPPPLPPEALKVSEAETSVRGNFCTNCGSRLGEAANFCIECGAKVV